MYATKHGLDTNTMQEVISRAMRTYPDNISRIERAIDIIFANDVTHLLADMWLVRGTHNYILDATGCPCDDARNRPQFTCKHAWSVLLVQWTLRRQQQLAARKVAA